MVHVWIAAELASLPWKGQGEEETLPQLSLVPSCGIFWFGILEFLQQI